MLLCDTSVPYSFESLLSWQSQWFRFLHQSSTLTLVPCEATEVRACPALSSHTLLLCRAPNAEVPPGGINGFALFLLRPHDAGVLFLEAQRSPTEVQRANHFVPPVLADLFFFALHYHLSSLLLISFNLASKLQC